jgi:hypothetical protein
VHQSRCDRVQFEWLIFTHRYRYTKIHKPFAEHAARFERKSEVKPIALCKKNDFKMLVNYLNLYAVSHFFG